MESFNGLLVLENSNDPACFSTITPVQDMVLEDQSIISLSLQSNDSAVNQNQLGVSILFINNDDCKIIYFNKLVAIITNYTS